MTQPAQQFIDAAKASQHMYGIPASVSLAQWALESGWGKHDLGCFNYFGMKAPCDAAGHPLVPHVDLKTREVDKYGHDYYITAPFRKFASPEEAFEEHAKLLATRGAYANARSKLPNADAFADALTGVYATDPNYGKSLKAIMHGSNLYQFDKA
jgi:flagellum-specific peptidoglycan hydrolase FlgJ